MDTATVEIIFIAMALLSLHPKFVFMKPTFTNKLPTFTELEEATCERWDNIISVSRAAFEATAGSMLGGCVPDVRGEQLQGGAEGGSGVRASRQFTSEHIWEVVHAVVHCTSGVPVYYIFVYYDTIGAMDSRPLEGPGIHVAECSLQALASTWRSAPCKPWHPRGGVLMWQNRKSESDKSRRLRRRKRGSQQTRPSSQTIPSGWPLSVHFLTLLTAIEVDARADYDETSAYCPKL
ncbi:hypothetical protein CYMTET_53567 [Cymbomonas tetramitiformis]|uniref:Uncharacterized protein n=1 Tax=Cymbomonas tetramitiformis TaxID=36881 RepID=A0AAE0BI58_9CHLO|nr:hypothetical protein CYMTET_53567 [Cymbomonas tetramitiformis]